MNKHETTIDVQVGQDVEIALIGDSHVGNIGCDEELLTRTVEYVRAGPKRLWANLGDIIEGIGLGHKYFCSANCADWLDMHDLENATDQEIERAKEIFRPIHPKCVGGVKGNHDGWSTRFSNAWGNDYPLQGWMGIARVNLRVKMRTKKHMVFPFDLCLFHGFGSAGTAGGKVNKLVRLGEMFTVDAVAMGHTHTKARFDPMALGFTDKIVEHSAVGVNTGAFLKGYTDKGESYCEKFGLRPSSLGAVSILFSVEDDRKGGFRKLTRQADPKVF